ncbi:hypothetical protein FY557_19770 [Chryseobacterium sp. SN22]|nr:hypothetical protein FY557_19770 [Chryseobacterium sp. SN22]
MRWIYYYKHERRDIAVLEQLKLINELDVEEKNILSKLIETFISKNASKIIYRKYCYTLVSFCNRKQNCFIKYKTHRKNGGFLFTLFKIFFANLGQ